MTGTYGAGNYGLKLRIGAGVVAPSGIIPSTSYAKLVDFKERTRKEVHRKCSDKSDPGG